MVGARKQAELPWLLRALEEGARVGGRHHLVVFPLHDENVAGPAGSLDPMAGTHLRDEGRPGRGHVVGSGVRKLGEAGRSVPRHHGNHRASPRGDPEGDEAAEARTEKAEASVESLVVLQVREDRLEIGDARGYGGVAIQSPGLAAPPEVEARKGETPLGKFPAEQEILVTVLAGAHERAHCLGK